MHRFVVALGFLLAGGVAHALEMPFTVGPITCRADAGMTADIPACKFDLNAPEKAATCTVNARTSSTKIRHVVQGSASPIGWRDMARGPNPFVFSYQGITCWLHIPDYVSGYRCTRQANGSLDCTACLKGVCYSGTVTIREVNAD
jgi:hypothetical protein